ncbi:SIR2 family protein [Mesorhizobium loti]|uniref:SIR2 family protein n=1 Tax=Rhizobium loti TaxID=381 RepID=UPI001377FC9E|nr:SIR2 family protein [Mesorhizobium loti]
MSKAFLIGAGASAEAGYPITKWLTYPVAHYLDQYRKKKRGKPSRLEQYLATVYSLDRHGMGPAALLWHDFVNPPEGQNPLALPDSDLMPSIIEILSVIDIAIAEQWSLGPSQDEYLQHRKSREFKGNELQRVRERVVGALLTGFMELDRTRPYYEAFKILAKSLARDDVVVTTNWDTLLDRAMFLETRAPPAYGTLGARLVDHSGHDLRAQETSESRRLYKLHGSFNWQYCPRCGDLYVSPDKIIMPMDETSPSWLDRECHCGAEMDGLVVTPSFAKRYLNVHLANIWRGAQKALEGAEEWIFVGYSLPDDDIWIRTMLLRAVVIRRQKDPPTIHVVSHKEDIALQRRYRQLFQADIAFHSNGFLHFLTR